MQLLKSKKGVSLPLVTGLVALLMISSAAVNELIIRTIQSVRRIEASNRAYLAAEGGIEDALYELAPHFAGYQTPDLDDSNNVRNSDFGGRVEWVNQWQIESHSDLAEWSGSFFPNQKLILSLFNDTNPPSVATNAINRNPANITTLKQLSGDFSITFTIPEASNFITDQLMIDNDEDYAINGVNEDPESGRSGCADNIDCDGDGKINEDGEEDPVILWKLTDGSVRSLTPYKGCLVINSGEEKSEICEKDFNNSSLHSVTLNQRTIGKNEDGQPETIEQFISSVDTASDAKLQFEFLIIAPLEHVDTIEQKKIQIPFLEYTVSSSSTDIPYPFFRIKSDGYYGTFKQSITTTVTPKTTVPLFDFTIIQQQ